MDLGETCYNDFLMNDDDDAWDDFVFDCIAAHCDFGWYMGRKIALELIRRLGHIIMRSLEDTRK